MSNSWSHYRSIAAKSAINLTPLIDKQQIQVIDLLSHVQEFHYKTFTTDLDKRLSQLPSNTVAIDNLSVLFTLGIDFEIIYKFVGKLSVNFLKNNAILGIGTHFATEEDDEEVNHFAV